MLRRIVLVLAVALVLAAMIAAPAVAETLIPNRGYQICSQHTDQCPKEVLIPH